MNSRTSTRCDDGLTMTLTIEIKINYLRPIVFEISYYMLCYTHMHACNCAHTHTHTHTHAHTHTHRGNDKRFYFFTVGGDSLAFVAARHGVNAPGNPFHFEITITKRGNQWNNATSIFTVKESHGVYYVGLSVGVDVSGQGDLTMVVSGQRYAGVTRTSTSHNNIDMIGRDVITELYAEETVHVSSSHRVIGGGAQDTTLTIFSITNSMMNQTVAFSVAREDSISGSADPVPFGVTLYNAGFHYDLFSHSFIAPSSGVYFFSFSLGLITGGTAQIVLT